jgi:TorA maturation chaperone TorD
MDSPLHAFCNACALDLLTLARLHDRELDPQTVSALQDTNFPLGMGLRLNSADGRGMAEALAEATRGLIMQPPADDELAADFAAIYLTHAFGASPLESVWLDEDGLAMQAPMFEIRAAYATIGLHAPDWRLRPDDHLVFQLQFVSVLLECADQNAAAQAAEFLDADLLRWLPGFAGRVAMRAATPFYAFLAGYTAAYLEELRDLLTQISGVARPQPEATAGQAETREQEVAPAAYVPGSAPSW